MSKWIEVYHPGLEQYFEPVTVPTEEDADALIRALVGGNFSGTWKKRTVDATDRPRPTWSTVPTRPTVEELLNLSAKHGQDIAILIVWNQNHGTTILTAGNQESHSQAAFEASQKVGLALGLTQEELIEDRRDEHGKEPKSSSSGSLSASSP
jgi:hypothetical protein